MFKTNQNFKVGPISQLVLQSTPFCNLSCRYCYLTQESRSNRVIMDPMLARDALAFVYDSGYADRSIMVRWHAGEPLSAGISFYEKAVDLMRSITPKGYRVTHTLQTNATFIQDDWCNFFSSNNFRVGVSIDGPQFIHDSMRVTRSGKGTFDLVMRGISFLKKHNIDFEVICVLTESSLDYANEIYDFFEEMGVLSLGFNIEEKECNNKESSVDEADFLEKYSIFMRKIFQRYKDGKLCIREIKEKENFMFKNNRNVQSAMNHPFNIISVDYNGNYCTFCPELLGNSHTLYGDFVMGNIKDTTIERALQTPLFQKMHHDIVYGTSLCEQKCPYFFLCGGGAPGNKLYENGTFASTLTSYCISRYQIPINTVLEHKLSNKVIS